MSSLPISTSFTSCIPSFIHLYPNFHPLLSFCIYVQCSTSFVYTCPPCLPLSFSCLLLCPPVLYIPCFTSFIAVKKKKSRCLIALHYLISMSIPVVPYLYLPPNVLFFLDQCIHAYSLCTQTSVKMSVIPILQEPLCHLSDKNRTTGTLMSPV